MRPHRSLPALALCSSLFAACTAEPVQIASNASPLEIDKIDILLVVDDSGSMASVKPELPALLEALVAGSDEPGAERPPLTDVHLGVVSTNMGTSHNGVNAGIPLCDGLGDDGIFRTLSEDDLAQCGFETPMFLSFEGDSASVASIDTAACIPDLGTEGCGFEQPLEAMLKALWPASDTSVEFLEGWPHGQGANSDFLRDDSLLLVIVVSDEDDCSASDRMLFTPPEEGGPLADVGLNLRCPTQHDYLFDVERYVDGLRNLRDGKPVMFALIGGIPPELVDADAQAAVDWNDTEAVADYYDSVLEAPAMQIVVDEDPSIDPQVRNILPSCFKPDGVGRAFPPRRLVEVAKRFGKAGVLGSLCAEDTSQSIAEVIRAAADNL